MVSRVYKSIVWLWMAVLLSASIGVSVQQVYCYCLGKTTTSLFVANDACQAHGRKSFETPSGVDCCTQKVVPAKKSCCEKPNPANQGCTKRTTKVFQLKTDFEVASSEFKKLDAPKFGSLLLAGFVSTLPTYSLEQVDFHCFSHPPPPPLTGRMLCVRHGVFRC